MGDSLSKIVAIIIAVVLLFIYPIMIIAERQDDTTRIFVLAETTKLVDSVRNLGYITTNMYKEYINVLAATNNIYNIKMEHLHTRVDSLETREVDDDSFQSDIGVNYEGYYTDEILDVIKPIEKQNNKYLFSKGDYFSINVRNINDTLNDKIRSMLLNFDFRASNINIFYGGMIKNEAD